MERKYLVANILVVLLMMTSIGSSGFSTEFKDPIPKPEIITLPFVVEGGCGWADTSGESNATESHMYMADTVIKVPLPSNTIIGLKISFNVLDFDQEHADTDDGSDPDNIRIWAFSDNYSKVEEGMADALTPFEGFINFYPRQDPYAPVGQTTYLDKEWEIHISCGCYGGKPFYYGPEPVVGQRPTPYVYKDFGFRYQIDIVYQYELMLAQPTTDGQEQPASD